MPGSVASVGIGPQAILNSNSEIVGPLPNSVPFACTSRSGAMLFDDIEENQYEYVDAQEAKKYRATAGHWQRSKRRIQSSYTIEESSKETEQPESESIDLKELNQFQELSESEETEDGIGD